MTDSGRDFDLEAGTAHGTGRLLSGPSVIGRGTAFPSPSDLASVVRRRAWTVLAVFIPVVAAAAVATYLMPRVYESESTFMIVDNAGEGRTGSSLELLDRIGQVRRIENEIEILRSRRVMAPTADRLDLHAKLIVGDEEIPPAQLLGGFDAAQTALPVGYELAPVGGDSLRVTNLDSGAPTLWAAGDTVRLDDVQFIAPEVVPSRLELHVDHFASALRDLERAVTVDRVGREADLVRLTCSAPVPERARELCVEMSDSYMELRNELHVAEATNARDFLSDAVEQIRVQLREAEDSLAAFTERSDAVALDARAEEEVRHLAGLTAGRDLKIAERAALRSYLNAIESGSGTARYRELASFPTFLENDAVTELVSSLVGLDNRRADLAVRRTEANPELASVNERIADIERQLRRLASSYERALTAQIDAMSGTLASGSVRVSRIPDRQLEYERRRRAVDQLETMHATLQTRLREAELAEGSGMALVRPMDAPQLPIEPASPSPVLNLVLASAFGLGLGLLLAGYREMSDVRLRDRARFELATGARVIGMLPSIDNPGPLLAQPREHVALKRLQRTGSAERQAPPGWKVDDWLASVEAFRTLAADLKMRLRSANGSEPPRSLAVMSSGPGEGKTYTACNLALVLASTGGRILLVDADLRMGRVAHYFGLPRDAHGLAEILTGVVPPEHALQQVSVTGGATLSVLAAGSSTGADVIQAADHLGRTVDRLARDFDLIILDTPPLNVVSDSTILAAMVDSILFVVRSGATRPDALEFAIQRLQRTNRNLVGLVLNDVKLPGYYSGYYGRDAGS